MKPTLLILAAGMGSRYGGLKQIEPFGPNGEAIIDYTIYDAIKAGFGKIVFVIRKSFAQEFKAKFEEKLQGKIEVDYVFQELDMLPEGYELPKERVKPWGTAHAILVAKDAVKEPFCALNADDFYGFNAFKTMANFLSTERKESDYAMVGYQLDKTLSDYGSVSRGICEVDDANNLKKIVENKKIVKEDGKIITIDDEGNRKELTGKESTSMNIWGFQPSAFAKIEKLFTGFLDEHINTPKSEMFIPNVVFDFIKAGEATVEVLKADSPWFGVTYKEDRPIVIEKINNLIQKGEYPEKLFN